MSLRHRVLEIAVGIEAVPADNRSVNLIRHRLVIYSNTLQIYNPFNITHADKLKTSKSSFQQSKCVCDSCTRMNFII